MDVTVKRAFHLTAPGIAGAALEVGRRQLTQPRLLLIDDEPALADFLASAARECGFEPHITEHDEDFRAQFLADRPEMVALDLGMPGMDGIELLRFLAEQGYSAPVLIVSGFDRRVLESAFRLGEALGLNMAGPVEKPVRLEDLETTLNELKATLVQ
jgi:DNA-binding response OmpR family regulator